MYCVVLHCTGAVCVYYTALCAVPLCAPQSVVHMDVKSSNVLLSARGVAKLGDVGLARLQTNTYLSDLPQMVGTFAW